MKRPWTPREVFAAVVACILLPPAFVASAGIACAILAAPFLLLRAVLEAML